MHMTDAAYRDISESPSSAGSWQECNIHCSRGTRSSSNSRRNNTRADCRKLQEVTAVVATHARIAENCNK